MAPFTTIAVSPTAAHNSRSPTPSSEHHDDAQKHKLYETRSSSRASDVLPGQISAQGQTQPDHKPQPPPQTLALRLSDDLDRRRRHSRRQSPMASRKSIVAAQVNLPSTGASRHVPGFRPLTPSNMAPDTTTSTTMATMATTTMPSSKYHKKPLIQDASMYTNSHLVRDSDNTNLEELAHIVRLSKYQERKRASTRIRLQRSLISTALSARLTRCGEMAHRYLVENFRKDDKDNFAALYNAIHDVRKSCDELRRYALLEPELETLNAGALGSSESLDTPTNSTIGTGPLRSITPFLHDVSASARETFIEFLTQIRTNPEYLATRICSLTSSELKEFLSFHKGLEPVESVLPFHARPPPRPHASASGRLTTTNSDIDRLLSFQRHDPLSILIHACFANSAGPDSSEDQRRTEVWATVLAQLIAEPKSTGEHFLICVLNIWTAMRDWSGKTKMEWYLMKILEDGAFLLDRAEDQHGTRFNVSDWDRLDEIAAKEFYEKAVNGLFELVDDDDATGIPEGLLELGNAILSKLEDKYVENTSKWLVWRCLFFVFLVSVIIHPEYYGMLAEYHITPYAREKILKKVAMKAHEFVSSMWSGNPSATCVPVNIPPKIKKHVENILCRFQGSQSKIPAAKLLPARSITSLRETVEVRPYLVISPADLLTLVNALFPEKRMTAGMRSGPASISISMAGQNSHRSFDTASIISTTAGSIFSEAINTREYYDPISPQRDSPPANDPDEPPPPKDFEDDGIRLRLALHELKQNLGPDVLRGSCHPCAERWVVLFISADGKGLSTTMTYDPDDELEDEDNSSSTDTDDDDGVQRPELDKDYHLLRNSILKLVEDYEIPRSLEPERGRAQLSNKASGLHKYGSRNRIVSPEKTTMKSRNPYRNQMHAESASPTLDAVLKAKTEEVEPVLITMLKAASAQSKAQADFVSAHMYWKTLNQLTALASSSLRQDGFAALINILARGPRDAFRRSASAIEDYDAWLVWLKQSQERHEGLIEGMMKRVDAIRNKMWYVTDVKNSKEWVHSRDICQALKTMAMPRRWSSFQRNRASSARNASSSFLYRTESQIMDLLAASEDQGGPNKLSDDQAEVTLLWLKQSAIENFCQGEERIHRFCCEVDRCTSKLVGENIREAPVLWSSELFKRDKLIHERAKRDRDHSWAGDDSTSIISSEQERRQTSSSGRSSSFARDQRSMATSTTSQHSFDFARYGHRAGGTLSDIPDGQEYFDKASPGHLDPGGTFWSPFSVPMSPSSAPSRAYSPTTSVTNVSTTFSGPTLHNTIPSTTSASTGRPGTSASSNETVQQQRVDDEKTRFLSDLKQTLTSLLLSDLGNQVLARGSETDNWFKKYGQQCIDRKDSLEKRARRKAEKKAQKSGSGRQRVIEKKDSFGNLRGMGGPEPPLGSMGMGMGIGMGMGGMESSSAAAVVIDAPSKVDSGEFPFKKAYQRLLNMFCVHPDPYAKLNALNELEQLIIASMLSNGSSKRTRWNRSDAGSSVVEDHQPGTRSVPLEGTIDNVKERRLHAIQGSLPPTGFTFQSRNSNSETRSIVSGSGGYGDVITKELLNLFRDASIRPKSLFRDLQFIAAFVPPSVLDKPERGKAFWDAGLAALELKSEVCRTMVEMADEALEAHTAARQASNDSAVPDISQSSSNSSSTPPSTIYDMEDIGRMWTIAAKEGLPTAQRELALFYLANPECVERTTLPLSKPREVFKQTVMEKYGRSDRGKLSVSGPSGSALNVGVGSRGGTGAGVGGTGDGPLLAGQDGDVRTDPGLMCVAVHWMEAAKKGDDELASSFLRQNEFMGLG